MYLTTAQKTRIRNAAQAIKSFEKADSYVLPELYDELAAALKPNDILALLDELDANDLACQRAVDQAVNSTIRSLQ